MGARVARPPVQMHSNTPAAAEAFMRMAFDIDVRHVVPAINVPTLIVHAAGDQVCHVENARFLARSISGSKYVELDSVEHVPWFDPDETIAEIREFLTGRARRARRIVRSRRCCSPISSARRSVRRRSATDAGGTSSSSITPRSAASSPDSTVARSTRRATASSPPSTARLERSAAHRRSSRACAHSTSPCEQGSTRARSSSPTARSPESPSTSARASREQAGAGEVLVSGTVKDLVGGLGARVRGPGDGRAQGDPGRVAALRRRRLRLRERA